LSSESSESSGVFADIDTRLFLELSHAEIDKFVIEIFSTEMGVTVGGFDLEDTFLNGEEGDIESTSTEIEDKNVLLLLGLSIKTVSNSGCSRFVNNTETV